MPDLDLHEIVGRHSQATAASAADVPALVDEIAALRAELAEQYRLYRDLAGEYAQAYDSYSSHMEECVAASESYDALSVDEDGDYLYLECGECASYVVSVDPGDGLPGLLKAARDHRDEYHVDRGRPVETAQVAGGVL